MILKWNSIKEEKHNKKSLKIIIIYSVLGILLMYFSMGQMVGLPTPKIFNMNIYPLNYAILQLTITILFLIYGFDIIKNGIKNNIRRNT